MGHGSVFEHASIVFQVAGVSRSLTHELIRHRVGTAYSQESQRYVDAKDIRFVVPPLLVNAYDPEASEERGVQS
jgi:thymidylate synthase (FAD)